jgi:hypothetical protein
MATLGGLLVAIGAIVGGASLQVLRAIASGLSPAPGATPPGMGAVEEVMRRVMAAEITRTIPFMIASGFLIWIALRLRKGEIAALKAAQKWAWWALGVVVLSVLIQLLVTVPATLEYSRKLTRAIPALPRGARGAPAFDPGGFFDTMMMISTLFSMIFGALFMSAWPVGLYFWSASLLRKHERPADG